MSKLVAISSAGDAKAAGMDALRWRIVSTRDHDSSIGQQHSFVYAVKTTRIYCRPSCHSRLARRANVLFYDTPAKAAAAGFRACKRCRPDDEARAIDGETREKAAIVRKAITVLEREHGDIALARLAKEVGLSTRYFCGLFRKGTGTTPGAYAKHIKKLHAQTRETSVMGCSLARVGTEFSDCFHDGGFQDVGFAQMDTHDSVLSTVLGEGDNAPCLLSPDIDFSAYLDLAQFG